MADPDDGASLLLRSSVYLLITAFINEPHQRLMKVSGVSASCVTEGRVSGHKKLILRHTYEQLQISELLKTPLAGFAPPYQQAEWSLLLCFIFSSRCGAGILLCRGRERYLL